MGIYAEDIETFFNEYKGLDNILHNYDNWTYHIQFYMVPVDIYKSYTLIKSNFNISEEERYNQVEKILLNNRIIIAESGVTSGISIDNLNLAAFTPTTLENRETTTTSIDMTLSEINSCTLMNKIAMASYVCGYQSYTTQPFFIEIWFTGYSNKSGNPVSKIYLPNQSNHIIYSCVMTTESSIVESGKTTYKFKLYPYYYSALTKELNVVNDIGEISADTSKSYSEFIQNIEQKINEKLAGIYGKEVMDLIYTGSTNGTYNKPVEIIIEGFNPIRYTESDEFKQRMNTSSLETAEYYMDKVEYKPNIDFSGGFWNDTWQIAKFGGAGLWNGIVGSAAAAYGATENFFTKAWTGIAGMNKKFTPEEGETLESFIRRISTSYYAPVCRDSAIICNFNYSMIYLGTHKGKMYYKHFIRITSNNVPGLREMNNLVCNYDESSKHYSDDPESVQKDYITYLTKYNLLTKKYKWLLNGENIDVLNIKRSDDNLWYMNIGISNIYNIKKNRLENQFHFDGDQQEAPKEYKLTVESAISKFNKISSNRANNGDLYIDDIYKILTDDDKQEGLSHLFGIVEASDPTIAIKPDSIPDITEESPPEQIKQAENEVNYKVGMYNIFQYGGQKMKVDMDIIGDPFWLIMGSEKDVLTHGCNGSTFMPHIILNVKTFMNLDENDNYKEDKFMDLTTIYIITQVTSFFDNGKFTQKLNGFVATPFIQSSFEEKTGEQIKSNENQRALATVPNG